jgi:hypothetical protein
VPRSARQNQIPLASPLETRNAQLKTRLQSSIRSFINWLDRTQGKSFDPYDLWGTRYGLFSRRLYYKKNPLGLPLVAPILLAEVLCPGIRRVFVEKKRFATADAQLLLAFLNLHLLGEGDDPGCSSRRAAGWSGTPSSSSPDSQPSTLNSEPLQRAVALSSHLLNSSLPGYRGHCWGYPFDWQNNHGLWKKNTPFITATPYCFEAFLGLFDVTGEKQHLAVAESIARFVQDDLHDTPTSADAAAGSYSPADHSEVINASAYRAMVLFEAARRFNEPRYRSTAEKNLNFILQNQREDGAWLYALDHPSERFIDHFHTCFVLKNLAKLNQHLNSDAVRTAVAKGYDYYRRELFDERGLPRSFTIQPRAQMVRLEMYNFAEAITLGVVLRAQIPAAFAESQRLASLVVDRYQLPAGYYVTRIYLGGLRHTFPFIRWPQSQIFYALTNLLKALDEARPGALSSLSVDTVG